MAITTTAPATIQLPGRNGLITILYVLPLLRYVEVLCGIRF